MTKKEIRQKLFANKVKKEKNNMIVPLVGVGADFVKFKKAQLEHKKRDESRSLLTSNQK